MTHELSVRDLITYLDVSDNTRRLMNRHHLTHPLECFDQTFVSRFHSSGTIHHIMDEVSHVRMFHAWIGTQAPSLLRDVSLCRRIIHQCSDLYMNQRTIQEVSDLHELLFAPSPVMNPMNLRSTLFGSPMGRRLSVSDARKVWNYASLPFQTEDQIFKCVFLILVGQKYKVNLLEETLNKGGYRMSTWIIEFLRILRDPKQFGETYCHVLPWDVYPRIERWFHTVCDNLCETFHPIQDLILIDDTIYLLTWYQIELDVVNMIQTYLCPKEQTQTVKSYLVDPTPVCVESCCICLETLSGMVTELVCKHVYHTTCITEWIKTSKTCPLCRAITKLKTSFENTWSTWDPLTKNMLNIDQRKAIESCLHQSLTVITGAGGTGKTEVARVLGQFVHSIGSDIDHCQASVFLAPTGKAAETIRNRLGKYESCFSLSTIHRWILTNESTPCPSPCIPYLLLDESGMVNLWTMWHLLHSAHRAGVQRIVLFGDPHQLPPIQNEGTLLDALTCMTRSSVVHSLTVNYRSSPGLLTMLNHLRAVATRTIHGGIQNDMMETVDSTLSIVTNGDTRELYHQILIHLRNSEDPKQTRVLVSRHCPVLHVDSRGGDKKEDLRDLHETFLVDVYNVFNPSSFRVTSRQFLVGDVVRSTVNVATRDGNNLIVANGSEGVVVSLSPTCIRFQDGLLLSSDNEDCHPNIDRLFRTLEHGTLMTIHKYQGSEADTIIGIFTGRFRDFNTIQLLYTAASRSKKKLILIMEDQTLDMYRKHPGRVWRNHIFNSLISEKVRLLQ
jgi:ATP-dependent exoDNAse (exonuclease V) alpha subunit